MNLITRFFAPRVTIDLSLDCVLFQKGDYTLRLETYAFVKHEGEKVGIYSIGDAQISTESGTFKAYLFQSDDYLQQDQRFLLLVEFIRYGTYQCVKEARKMPLPPLLKPVVTLQGLEKLEEIFLGYQQTLLVNATRISAAEIVIPE